MRTMHEWAVDELVRRIVSGEAAPGDALPVEEKLAAELGVSRGVLREAVKSVVGKGMPGIRPRTGTRVLPPAGWDYLDADVLRRRQEYEPRRLLRETVELSRRVEPAAARPAAARRSPGYVEADAAVTAPCSTPAATGSSARWAAPWTSPSSTASRSAARPTAELRDGAAEFADEQTPPLSEKEHGRPTSPARRRDPLHAAALEYAERVLELGRSGWGHRSEPKHRRSSRFARVRAAPAGRSVPSAGRCRRHRPSAGAPG
uniref:FadR/GntR family transcriptional regulator n=1 Tax=Streptomyces albicerus TaxID=2569859 RepID=UPI00384D9B1E